jgi:hypothetical protein
MIYCYYIKYLGGVVENNGIWTWSSVWERRYCYPEAAELDATIAPPEEVAWPPNLTVRLQLTPEHFK